ncbi:hypothetical protein [uncultured Eubacterium sp.]|uniref:hypothetical protein n=1 Tax=uncultured Eubacterium sp. TaxID=165185 RepID=UPI002599C399|nr:hypothetical protein [uncultured Eubacterium sp.]
MTLLAKLQRILAEKRLKIIPENLRAGVTAFGVTGTLDEGIDTSDATATENDLAKNKTAYVNGQKITGELDYLDGIPINAELIDINESNSSINVYSRVELEKDKVIINFDQEIDVSVSYADVAQAIELDSDDIKYGATILGVAGTYDGVDTSDATATAEDIVRNKTAYVNGEKIVGTNDGGGSGGNGGFLISLNENNKIAIDCNKIADIIENNYTSSELDECTIALSYGAGHDFPAINLTHGFQDNILLTGCQFCLIVDIAGGSRTGGLKLCVFEKGENVIEIGTLVSINTATEQYFNDPMTLNNLISVLRYAGIVHLDITDGGMDYKSYELYNIIGIKIGYAEDYDSSICRYIKVNNDFITIKPNSYTSDIKNGTTLIFNGSTIASMLNKYLTSEQKNTIVTIPSESSLESHILDFGKCTVDVQSGSSIHRYDNCSLFIAYDGVNSISLYLNDNIHSGVHLMTLFTESSEIEIPNPCRMSDIINIFASIGTVEQELDGLEYSNIDKLMINVPIETLLTCIGATIKTMYETIIDVKQTEIEENGN